MKFIVNEKVKNLSLSAVPFILLLALWYIAVEFNWMPNWFLPSPENVAAMFIKLLRDGTMFKVIADTVANIIPPYLFAVVASVLFGVLIGTSNTIRKIFFPLIVFILFSHACPHVCIYNISFPHSFIWICKDFKTSF